MDSMQSECIEWPGARDHNGYGYGRITIGRKRYRVSQHRMAYELAYGPIPKGMFVLHSCDNPPCVNVTHLRLGTQVDNMADTVARGRQGRYNAKKTHCKHGHEFTEENTRRSPARPNERICKECMRGHWRAWYARKTAA